MDTFNPLDHPICFEVPDRINVPSAWYEHIPFAFYLTEIERPKCLVELGTHNGASFLAFCKAVQALSLDTKCFAIDTWEGDKMAGYYGQEVYDELREYHDSRYSKFSSLLKMTFDEGTKYFSDNSIDLLHIDGLHTYEAVKHDFENWFRKLTPNAIVLFHDTNVHENDFGVWKYWEELKKKYTSFEFFHGHGLGVLTLADYFPQGLRGDNESSTINKFRTFFALLGQKHLFENSIQNSKHELEILHGQIESLNSTNSRSNELVERVTQEKANVEQTIQKLESDLAAEKANTTSANRSLEEKSIKLHQQMVEKDEAQSKELNKLSNENYRLEQEYNKLISQNSELAQSLNFANHEIIDYYNSTSWKLTRPLRWISKKLRGSNG